jgi:hypothetical protein
MLKHVKLIFNDNNFLISSLIILAIFGSPFSLLIKIFILKINSIEYINPFVLYRILLCSLVLYLFFKLKNKFNPNYIGLIFIFLIFYFNIIFNNTFEVMNTLNSKYLINDDNILKFYEDKNKSVLINFFNIFLIIMLFTIKNIYIDFEYLRKKMQIMCKIFLYLLILIGLIWIIQNSLNKTNTFYNLVKNVFTNDNFWINSHYISYVVIINFVLFLDKFSKKIFFTTLIYTGLVFSLELYVAIYIMMFLLTFNLIISKYKLNVQFYILSFNLIIFLPIIYYYFANFFSVLHLSNFEKFSTSIVNRLDIYKFYLDNINNLNIFYGNSLFNHNIATYPHNLVLDILYSTGLVGLFIFFVISYNISKKIVNSKNFFITNLFISFLVFSSLSGYFFFNT